MCVITGNEDAHLAGSTHKSEGEEPEHGVTTSNLCLQTALAVLAIPAKQYSVMSASSSGRELPPTLIGAAGPAVGACGLGLERDSLLGR